MASSLLAKIHALDVRTFIWCASLQQRQRLTRISRYLSASADGPWYIVLALLMLWLSHEFDQQLLKIMLFAVLIERLIYYVAKNSFRRNRPQDALPDFKSSIRPADRFSLPSGHTSCAFLFAYFMALIFPALQLLWFIWASGVGMSRIMLGVHFPTDTVIGAIIGVSVASWSMSYFVL